VALRQLGRTVRRGQELPQLLTHKSANTLGGPLQEVYRDIGDDRASRSADWPNGCAPHQGHGSSRATWEPEDLATVTMTAETDPTWLRLQAFLNTARDKKA
jgi:hypothetical protein